MTDQLNCTKCGGYIHTFLPHEALISVDEALCEGCTGGEGAFVKRLVVLTRRRHTATEKGLTP